MPLLHDYSEISPYSTHNNRVAKSGKEVRLACFITMQEVSTGVVLGDSSLWAEPTEGGGALRTSASGDLSVSLI
eukprot:scaffold18685_cov16-Tisochrysis_lutea.AAC.1